MRHLDNHEDTTASSRAHFLNKAPGSTTFLHHHRALDFCSTPTPNSEKYIRTASPGWTRVYLFLRHAFWSHMKCGQAYGIPILACVAGTSNERREWLVTRSWSPAQDRQAIEGNKSMTVAKNWKKSRETKRKVDIYRLIVASTTSFLWCRRCGWTGLGRLQNSEFACVKQTKGEHEWDLYFLWLGIRRPGSTF